MNKETKSLLDSMDEIMEGKPTHPFYCFEPWEPEPNTGRKFQTSFFQSTSRINLSVAGNRNGKTLMEAVDAVIMMTGRLPICFQYPKGHVTDIPRPWKKHKTPKTIDNLNKLRFGFLDPDTGRWIPPLKKPDMPEPDDRTDEAPCGYIVGVGEYPAEKICPQAGSSIWITSWSQVINERWVPLLKQLIPKDCLSLTSGIQGFSKKDHKFYLHNGSEMLLISYEKGHRRVQGAGIWAVKMDEEPLDRKFWTELDQRLIDAGFQGWMSMSYTPLNGISWSYEDLYKPALDGKLKHVSLFNATQYDSPFIAVDVVDEKRSSMKAWEIKPRIYGQFSDMKGKPYYDYEKLLGDKDGGKGWIHKFVTIADYAKLMPTVRTESRTGLFPQIPKFHILTKDIDISDPTHDFWELYEKDVKIDGRYLVTADTAEPNTEIDSDIDRNVAYVFRCPLGNEDDQWPVLVASMRVGINAAAFAREMMLAGMYWNGAVLAPERRGETGATALAEIREYPWKYLSTVQDERTRRITQKIGFDTTQKTRTPVFDLVGDYINSHDSAQCMKHRYLLKEASQIIYGRRGRPDHPDKGTSDCVVAFGIGLYIYRYDEGQIQNHRDELALLSGVKNKTKSNFFLENEKPRGYCTGRHGRSSRRSVFQ